MSDPELYKKVIDIMKRYLSSLLPLGLVFTLACGTSDDSETAEPTDEPTPAGNPRPGDEMPGMTDSPDRNDGLAG